MKNKNLTIYDVYVELESEEQFDRLIDACKNNGLDTDVYDNKKYFHCNGKSKKFCDWNRELCTQKKVTESEFIELIKTTK